MSTNPNMEAIQTVTVGAGGASSIDFTSIPQTYTDLQIVLSGRQSAAGGTNVNMKFNGSSSGYTNRNIISAAGTVVSESSVLGTSSIKIGFIPENVNYTASTFSNQYVYIPSYAGSSNKSVSTDNAMENNSTSVYFGLFSGFWSNTSAITSIALTCENGNFVQYSTATLYGVTSTIAGGAKAYGGTVTEDANYFYHTFLASGTFTPTSNITADYLVVAGGGGGSGSVNLQEGAGGGGAGGLRCTVTATGGGGSLESALSLTASTNYTVTVGAGGAGGTTGSNGSDSVFSSITSTGGGRGAIGNGGAGVGGGSGGGASSYSTGGTGTANQGYAGGAGSSQRGSGGGGAGAVGATGTASGNGGAGVATSITGSSVTYAGGGGGGGSYTSGAYPTGGSGGTGGGGAGGNGNFGTGTAGTANTGGGGGAGAGGNSGTSNGGAGGSGIVIVRYAK